MWVSRGAGACFFCNDTATTEIYTLSLHDALPICAPAPGDRRRPELVEQHGLADAAQAGEHQRALRAAVRDALQDDRSEEHTSELQSRQYLVCRLLLDKKPQPPPPTRSPRRHIVPR